MYGYLAPNNSSLTVLACHVTNNVSCLGNVMVNSLHLLILENAFGNHTMEVGKIYKSLMSRRKKYFSTYFSDFLAELP